MSDIKILPETKVSTGSLLASARHQQNLSLNDIAQHLKLGVKQIEALEADDYDKLPGRTFVRGFIRNYAKLLQIDPEPLLNSCPIEPPQQLRTVETSIGEIPSPYISNKIWIKYSIAAIIVLILITSAGLFFKRYEYKPLKKSVATIVPLKTPVTPPISTTTDKPQPPTLATDLKPQAIPLKLKDDVSNNPKLSESISVEPISIPLPAPTPSDEERGNSFSKNTSGVLGTLQFFFNEEAWVEVTDASNKVIFYQLNPAGIRRTVKGQPPLQVVVGNAAHVTMTYNNKPINLTPYIKVEVARLTLK